MHSQQSSYWLHDYLCTCISYVICMLYVMHKLPWSHYSDSHVVLRLYMHAYIWAMKTAIKTFTLLHLFSIKKLR